MNDQARKRLSEAMTASWKKRKSPKISAEHRQAVSKAQTARWEKYRNDKSAVNADPSRKEMRQGIALVTGGLMGILADKNTSDTFKLGYIQGYLEEMDRWSKQ